MGVGSVCTQIKPPRTVLLAIARVLYGPNSHERGLQPPWPQRSCADDIWVVSQSRRSSLGCSGGMPCPRPHPRLSSLHERVDTVVRCRRSDMARQLSTVSEKAPFGNSRGVWHRMGVRGHLLRRGCRAVCGLGSHRSPTYALSHSLRVCGSHVLSSFAFRPSGSCIRALGKRKSPGTGFWGVGPGMHFPVSLGSRKSWLRLLTAEE